MTSTANLSGAIIPAFYRRRMGESGNIIGERLRERLDDLRCDQAELADAVGISQSAISQILSGATRNSRHLPAIADHLAINLAWLRGATETKIELFDDAGARISEADIKELASGARVESGKLVYRGPPMVPVEPDPRELAEQLGSVLLPQYEMGFSMGGGMVADEDEPSAMVPMFRDWLRPMMGGSFADLFVTRGRGDSMLPTLMDRDLAVVDRAQHQLREQDAIWALVYGDLGMIKRVRRLPDGGYQINSDNPAVTPITAYDGEMHIVGRVIWIGRRV